jgi:hypothetical protein
LQNYTLGGQLGNSNFVSFTYSSNLIPSLTIPQSDSPNLSGSLPAVLPASAAVTIYDSATQMLFTSATSGSWSIGIIKIPVPDTGSSSTWNPPATTTTVPTLSTAILCALGLLLAGAGALLVRARRTARA